MERARAEPRRADSIMSYVVTATSNLEGSLSTWAPAPAPVEGPPPPRPPPPRSRSHPNIYHGGGSWLRQMVRRLVGRFTRTDR